MSASRHVTIWCDEEGCVNFIDHGEHTTALARRSAMGEGWTYKGGKDRCMHHSGKCGRYCMHRDHLGEPRPID